MKRVLGSLTLVLICSCTQDVNHSEELVAFQLRNIVKEIEYFKVVSGEYPTRLAQLSNDIETVLIDDPFAGDETTGCTPFLFRRDKDRYTLRSVGRDGLAMTADDVLPLLTDEETRTLGWTDAAIDTDPGEEGSDC